MFDLFTADPESKFGLLFACLSFISSDLNKVPTAAPKTNTVILGQPLQMRTSEAYLHQQSERESCWCTTAECVGSLRVCGTNVT